MWLLSLVGVVYIERANITNIISTIQSSHSKLHWRYSDYVCMWRYPPSLVGARRGLGMRRCGLKTSLHDPFEENALVLYSPREVSAQEQLKTVR